jgi:hypothetical protein
MADDPTKTPDQQGNPPGQQDGGNPPAAEAGNNPPAGYVEQARYNGLVKKVQELTLQIKGLEGQLATQSSEAEQLKGQLAVKDTEKTVAVGERDKALQEALQKVSALEKENKELKGLQLKVKVINELERPELLRIADRIPALEDEEALKIVLQDFAGFADDLVKKREEQLMAGFTPNLGGSGNHEVKAAPATAEAWLEKINSLPLGSKERTKTLDDYGNWLEKQHQPSS